MARKLLVTAASLMALSMLISMAPDIVRYVKISRM
jgi:hypothetical protein